MAHILVIDDEEMLRDMLREVLEVAGYEVSEAGDGNAGLEAYKENRADVVITDIMMPEKDGFETIRDLVEVDPSAKIIARSPDSACTICLLPTILEPARSLKSRSPLARF